MKNILWEIYNSIKVSDFDHHNTANDNWFKYYNLNSEDDVNDWISYTNVKFPPHLYKNKIVVDMGCGWGLFSILAYLQGASRVFAIGPDNRIDFLEKIISDNSISDRITTIKKYLDTNTQKILNKKVDVIIGNEFIEHLTSTQRINFYRIAFESLVDKGILLLHTHNTDNKKVLKRVKMHWEKQENKIYIKMREELISNQCKELDTKQKRALAEVTFGLNKDEVIKASLQYLKDKKFPQKDFNKCSIDPESGVPDENYISPEVIQAEMLAAGFSTHVYPWFGFFSLGRILRSIASLLPFVFFRQIVESITFYGVKD